MQCGAPPAYAGHGAKLDTRIAELEAKLDTRTGDLEARIREMRSALEAAWDRRLHQAESRLVRWTFAFWAPTMLAADSLTIGVLLKS